MENLTKEYSTKDLGEVAALITAGHRVKALHWKNAVAYFVFADRPTCEDLQQRYYLGQLPLDARTLFDTLRGLKRRLYQHERPRT
jgi:hypothetical protein